MRWNEKPTTIITALENNTSESKFVKMKERAKTLFNSIHGGFHADWSTSFYSWTKIK